MKNNNIKYGIKYKKDFIKLENMENFVYETKQEAQENLEKIVKNTDLNKNELIIDTLYVIKKKN